jgi:hypothetical protein
MSDWLHWLEATALAVALRDSVWAYPLVNAAHLLGVSLLVGAIVSLDLRLLGFWPGVSAGPAGQMLRGVAATGLLLALFAGGVLFVTRAPEYAASSFFLAKMGFVCVGGVNALVVSRVPPERLAEGGAGGRFAAGVSLLCWIGALVLGRLVGYF